MTIIKKTNAHVKIYGTAVFGGKQSPFSSSASNKNGEAIDKYVIMEELSLD